MKFKYVFANETVEIDVSEDWANILIDLDRQEYNNTHAETRRHCSLEALNLDDTLIPSDVDLERDVFGDDENDAVMSALRKLKPAQSDLLKAIYIESIMGALNMGVPEEELKPLVDAWRQSNPYITKLWWDVDRAATTCVKQRTTAETHGIRFIYQSGMMFIVLPSGRKLVYVKPKMGLNKFGSESITYEGVGTQKKWTRLESYGPKFVENIVQATARDILAEAMLRLDAAGYKIVMHVHDEAVIEAPADTSLEDICRVMGQTPSWADGLILRADGYICDFYKKD